MVFQIGDILRSREDHVAILILKSETYIVVDIALDALNQQVLTVKNMTKPWIIPQTWIYSIYFELVSSKCSDPFVLDRIDA